MALVSYEVAYRSTQKLISGDKKLSVVVDKEDEKLDISDVCRSELLEGLDNIFNEFYQRLMGGYSKDGKLCIALVNLVNKDSYVTFVLEFVFSVEDVDYEKQVSVKTTIYGKKAQEPIVLRNLVKAFLEKQLEPKKLGSSGGGFLALCALGGLAGSYAMGYLDEPIKKLGDWFDGEESLRIDTSVDCCQITRAIAQVYRDQRDKGKSFSSICVNFRSKPERQTVFRQQDLVAISFAGVTLASYEAHSKIFWEQFGFFELLECNPSVPQFKTNLKQGSSVLVVVPLSLFVARWQKAQKISYQHKPTEALRRPGSSVHAAKMAQELGRLPLTCETAGEVYHPLLNMCPNSDVTIVLIDDLLDTTISSRYSNNGEKKTKKDFIKECFKSEVDLSVDGFGGECNIAYFSEADGLCMLFYYQKLGILQSLKRRIVPSEAQIDGVKVEDFVLWLKRMGFVF